jgi:hypothetical protein
MSMASTIQPYANDKNRPISLANMGGLGMGDALMLQMEDAAIGKQKAQLAATAGTPKNALGPMTLSALGGSFFS